MHFIDTLHLSSALWVCFLPTPWNMFQSQGLLTALARHTDVLLVEPPIDILTSVVRPARLINRLKRYRSLSKLQASIYLFQPLGLASYGAAHRFPAFVSLNKSLLERQVSAVLSKLPSHKYLIVHAFSAAQYYTLDVLQPDLRVFDVTDEFYANLLDDEIDFERPETVRYMRAERKVFDRADVVFVASSGLYDSRSKLHHRVIRIPVGCVDLELFSQALRNDLPIPADIAAVPKPRIGFVGNINELLDIESLMQLAQTRPARSLVLVGAVNAQPAFKRSSPFRQLMARPNVHYLGWHPYESLPGYMKAMDVCLMPYRLNAWMRNAHPNKTYQYLAAGKPVVSTAFPEVIPLERVISVAKHTEDFISAVDEALNRSDTAQDIASRLEIARQNSSRVRAQQRAVVLAEMLGLQKD